MKYFCITLLMLVTSMSCFGAAVEKLSPELRALLIKEMQFLKKGMLSINELSIAGETEEIAIIADKMKNSYILKQSLTKAHKTELMTNLPKHFFKLDKQFHDIADKLSHVSSKGNMELVSFYQYKLSESCAGCHSQFAQHRFPKFKRQSTSDHHH